MLTQAEGPINLKHSVPPHHCNASLNNRALRMVWFDHALKSLSRVVEELEQNMSEK